MHNNCLWIFFNNYVIVQAKILAKSDPQLFFHKSDPATSCNTNTPPAIISKLTLQSYQRTTRFCLISQVLQSREYRIAYKIISITYTALNIIAISTLITVQLLCSFSIILFVGPLSNSFFYIWTQCLRCKEWSCEGFTYKTCELPINFCIKFKKWDQSWYSLLKIIFKNTWFNIV